MLWIHAERKWLRDVQANELKTFPLFLAAPDFLPAPAERVSGAARQTSSAPSSPAGRAPLRLSRRVSSPLAVSHHKELRAQGWAHFRVPKGLARDHWHFVFSHWHVKDMMHIYWWRHSQQCEFTQHHWTIHFKMVKKKNIKENLQLVVLIGHQLLVLLK